MATMEKAGCSVKDLPGKQRICIILFPFKPSGNPVIAEAGFLLTNQ